MMPSADAFGSSGTSGVRWTPSEAVEQAFDRIDHDGRTGIWIELIDRDVVRSRARAVEARLAAGAVLPLAGRTLAVKANLDLAGLRTTAGCPSFGTIAKQSAEAVRQLEAAGAVTIGSTNLDQFATGLVGTRSPHGICPNAHWPGYISGGSSSGSAVAVATGVVDLALGTDTAGSGRVPAAANGIIGVKPTRGRVSTAGLVPACRALDCVSLFGADLDLLAVATSILFEHGPTLAATTSTAGTPRASHVRIAVPRADDLEFDGDELARTDFTRATSVLVAATASEAIAVDFEPFARVGCLLYEGAFVAERYEAVGEFIEAHPDEVDPIVGAIVLAAGRLPEGQLERDQGELARLRTVTERTWRDADVLIVPSVPRLPTVAEVLAEPVAVNSMLGTYTNFVNLLDLCALTIPVPLAIATDPAERAAVARPPASVTLIAPAGQDSLLLEIARLAVPR